jgi:hypothetical protein
VAAVPLGFLLEVHAFRSERQLGPEEPLLGVTTIQRAKAFQQVEGEFELRLMEKFDVLQFGIREFALL